MINQLFILLLLFASIQEIFPQINTERFRKSQDSLGFGGSADLFFTVMTGNTDLQIMRGQFRLNYNGGDNYTFAILGGDYGWQKGNPISSEAILHIRHVNTLTNLMQLELFAQADYSKPRKLQFRELGGAGLRFRFIRTEQARLSAGIGMMYEHEKYSLPQNAIHPEKASAFRSTNYISSEIHFNEYVNFFSTIYYQPSIELPADFKVIGENRFSSEIAEDLSVVVSVNFRLDNRPPDGVKKFDLNSGFGFNYAF